MQIWPYEWGYSFWYCSFCSCELIEQHGIGQYLAEYLQGRVNILQGQKARSPEPMIMLLCFFLQ